VGVDPDGERAEILDAELPETFGHELLPGHFLDLLDLCRLERRGAADDREVHHAVLAHRRDGLVGQPALAADRAHSVVAPERLREADHPRARRRPDGDWLVAARTQFAHARRGVQEKRAAQIHRRLDALVEDADLRAVANADDVTVDEHGIAGVERADRLLVGREGDLTVCHQASRS
jgi:hypothetical protein